MDLETSNPQHRGPVAIILVGGSSGALGFIVATGVGSAPLDLLLAVFVSVLAVAILSQYVDVSGRLIGETLPGLLAGVTIETLGANIIFSIAIGALAAFLISSLRSRASLSGFTLKNSNALPRVVLALLVTGLLPVYLFGRFRGIQVEALIAYAFITSPIWATALLRYLRKIG